MEFQHGLVLNHTNLVQSQMVGFDLWPSNIKQRWLAKKLGSSLCVTSWYVSFSRASYENATVPNGIVLVNSKQTERHSERWRHLWFHESEITHTKSVLLCLTKKQLSFKHTYLLHRVLISTYRCQLYYKGQSRCFMKKFRLYQHLYM